MRRRLRNAASPILEGLEARTLLAGSVASGALAGSLRANIRLHASGVERAQAEHHAGHANGARCSGCCGTCGPARLAQSR